MKNTKSIILFAFLISLIVSCEKEPSASFDVGSNLYSGEDISFTNTSSDADSYMWDFGDGEESTEMNPTHYYKSPGNYTVTLTATNDDGSNSTSKALTISQGTQLHLNVMYEGSLNAASNFEIRLFDTYDDWFNWTNVLLESKTDDYGEIDIIGVSTIVYYIDAYYETAYGYWSNWDLGYMTDALVLHEVNNYNVYVEYTASKKAGAKSNYIIKRIEPAHSNVLELKSTSKEPSGKVFHKVK